MNKYKEVRLLQFALVIVAGINSSCNADLLIGTGAEEIQAESVEKLIQIVTGLSDPIWTYTGKIYNYQNNNIQRSASIIYQPFRSSNSFCRTHVTEITTPSPKCDDEQCLDLTSVSFEVTTRAFLAIVPEDSATVCSELDFEKDYFSLKNDFHDLEVMKLLSLFQTNFNQWKSMKSKPQDACNFNQLTQEDLVSIGLKPENEMAVVTYELTHPCSMDRWVSFILKLKGSEVMGFELAQIQFDKRKTRNKE